MWVTAKRTESTILAQRVVVNTEKSVVVGTEYERKVFGKNYRLKVLKVD